MPSNASFSFGKGIAADSEEKAVEEEAGKKLTRAERRKMARDKKKKK